MTSEDESEVLSLMLQSGFPISGLVTRSIYSSLCKDALTCSDTQVAVAAIENRIVAFLLTITDWTRYWRRFMLRHPVPGLRIVKNRARRYGKHVDVWPQLLQSDREYVRSIISDSPSGRSWSDSSPSIAKVVFVQVDPQFRGRRLGVGLYYFLMDYLASRGVTRIDAKVDLTNRRAMPLHVSVGYRLERTGNSLFATKDLSK
jgi:GNAT superfamily N-acetyltransferase